MDTRTSASYVQEPIAVVGLSCRLPGNSNSPKALWDFLNKGGIARNEPPASRFNLSGHHDGSKKNKTMRTAGGMFLESIDPADFDAGFFGISHVDAVAMDPQQRQLLEVVYEGLENAGISLECLDGQAIGCFVGSYAVDYADMHNRDPEDRPAGVTVGVGRAILSNRISHFLNIKGPSFTIDTACSGGLVAVDVACRYLNTREINGAIVAASNLYLSPEHNMDGGAMKGAASLSGKCHTFDVKADGYCKAEAVNAVILKRLDDAIRDGDPIRAIIRGSAQNSDGRTPGIASPSSEAQAVAIRAAYANAGITDFNATTYLECHGTGTQAGDPIEVTGASSVFGAVRSPDQPLLIGSIKSNVGHSEPAAGISGLLKAILSIENGAIPGNPTFITPNPKIDFHSMNVRASRTTIPWPAVPFRRVSVNSFGYGGSNAHVVLDEAKTALPVDSQAHVSSFVSDFSDFFDDDELTRPYTLVFSANDESSLKAYCKSISTHLINPSVNVKLPDLSYTLSERRSRHFHRAYIVTQGTTLDDGAFVFGKKNTDRPRIGFVFTGQGAQWPQMGKSIVETFPSARLLLEHFDHVLQTLPSPPTWSLLGELTEPRTADHLRIPEFSQPLVTALQLVMMSLLESWDVSPMSVVGHSSGEIAAACAAGLVTPEEAIKIAYYRGQGANNEAQPKIPVGMLAVGLGSDQVQEYLAGSEDAVMIGCYNSPTSVTLSGSREELEKIMKRLQADGHFARMLQVNAAYHSMYMKDLAGVYEEFLLQNCEAPSSSRKEHVTMFSSVLGRELDQICNAQYWKTNMISPVRFDEAVTSMLSGRGAADFLIEIGPSGALAGPIKQIKKALGGQGNDVQYCAAANRGPESVKTLFDVAGRLFVAGGHINLSKVNADAAIDARPSVVVDLPNYVWNHSTKYWQENESSKDWRFRLFPHHDLLGSKVLGTSWHAPSWKKVLRVEDLHWLQDHKMGHEIVFPAAAFIAMAIEAIYQARMGIHLTEGSDLTEKTRYRLRNVTFPKALVLPEKGDGARIVLSLTPRPQTKDSWHEFKILSVSDNVWSEHSRGLVTVEKDPEMTAAPSDVAPLQYPTKARSWYKAMSDAGYSFGPVFQKHLEVESISGSRKSRSLISMTEPEESYPQSPYPMHPVCIDGCFQSVGPSLWKGIRSAVSAVLVPALIDDLIISSTPAKPEVAVSITSSKYVGVGRQQETKNYMSDAKVYNKETGALLLQVSGLRYHKLDTRESPHTAHAYSRVDWKPDITYLNQEKLALLPAQEIYNVMNEDTIVPSKIHQVIDLVAHKKPNLRVMEVNMMVADLESVWLEGTNFDKTVRTTCSHYHFASIDATALMGAQEKFSSQSNIEFSVMDISKPTEDLHESEYDLVIVKHAPVQEAILTNMARNVRGLLADGGHILSIETFPLSMESDSDSDVVVVHGTEFVDATHTAAILETNHFNGTIKLLTKQQSLDSQRIAYLAAAKSREITSNSTECPVALVHLCRATETGLAVKDSLKALGWDLEDHSFPFTELNPQSIVLIVDDLSEPLLARVRERQWQSIKELTYKENRILWVTVGSQLKVTNPDNALIHGLVRTMRAEDPALSFTTLDVESSSGPDTITAIHRVLVSLEKPIPTTMIENEFVERRGIIHINRIRPDDPINKVEKENSQGAEFVTRNLHESETLIRLQCERLGTLDSLKWTEVSQSELPLTPGCIEVEIVAAGVNFKDVAVTMGIVPENEHTPGLEGAGIVRRIGNAKCSFKVGERVLVYEKGTFANRVQLTPERCFRLPDSMSFEDAATMPSVYLVAIYGLYHVAKLQKGQSVLIHSASGGVGIAAIQLCKHVGAQIYCTVGTDEKRKFLMEILGIPSQHIFNSRNITFASEIMAITDGKGVDVCLNSLTGELLDESWRCIADGGHMVEIGKKDVLDRNWLTMEPFNRNASFHGVDMSHKSISDPLIARLISELMDLIANGHVKPINPMKVFPFEEIGDALRYLRSGTHLGKIVISNGLNTAVELPVRPAKRTLALRADVSYLVVGGLKGLCGSLAVYLARQGAKHLVIMSRSGYDDERSQGVLQSIYAEGCQVDLIKGDVSVLADVQRTFKAATSPIAGVIQGAMVLRDKIFTSMTSDDFHQTISSKVTGTWNLHHVSMAQATSLDFFTTLSSISGVVGNKGQANYAAANVFLDNFASYRHSLGLVANSIDLGSIEDVGYVAEHEDLVFDTDVWTPINESLLHKILTFSIWQQSPTHVINKASAAQLITGIAIPQQFTSTLLRDARFGPLASGEGNSAGSSNGGKNEGSKDIQALFLLLNSKAEQGTVLGAAVDIVNKQFTSSLRLPAPMEPAKPLASYGLDSLAAVEFRNWLRAEIGAELSTLEITGATSLFALCEKIVAKIAPVSAVVGGA
ncbi:MAG: hypothetical protein M1818_003497 [Claussenomyces sp. TS43310]|nr:MAG: hypothetical protein M1818_003497 [Claussenomyces sp. TS43310]